MRTLNDYPLKQWTLNEVLEVKGRYIHNKISNMINNVIIISDSIITWFIKTLNSSYLF